MNAIHRITGYEKRSERLEIEHDVPPERLSDLMKLAHVPSTDVDALGSYRLEPEAVRKAANQLHVILNTEAYDWFLEPFSAD
jgi:hypothetical protein